MLRFEMISIVHQIRQAGYIPNYIIKACPHGSMADVTTSIHRCRRHQIAEGRPKRVNCRVKPQMKRARDLRCSEAQKRHGVLVKYRGHDAVQ
jgi:hypothetical protein